jgi:hypothetical protein
MARGYALSLGIRGSGEDVIAIGTELATLKEYAQSHAPEGVELAWHNSDPQKRWLTESFEDVINNTVDVRRYYLITRVAKL